MKSVTALEDLARPFESADLEWRVMRSGSGQKGPWAIVTPYVDRAAIINRLNQVCGIGGWQSSTRFRDGHVSVGIGIRVEDEWVWRWDGTGNLEADPPHFSQADAGKGDFSMAFKRACEHFGIALYLRELKDLFAIFNDNGRYRVKIGGQPLKWDPPGIEGTPSYPGQIPGGPSPTPSRSSSPTPPPNEPPSTDQPPSPPAEPSSEDIEEQLKDAKLQVRAFMKDQGYRVYHLEALISLHKDLNQRFVSVDELGRKGGLQDWGVLLALCNPSRAQTWEEGPKKLAGEFPTGPDRIALLDKLQDSVQLDPKERLEIESQKGIGWNDAIEYWIQDLGQR